MGELTPNLTLIVGIEGAEVALHQLMAFLVGRPYPFY